MAEARPPETEAAISSDEADGTVLHCGEVLYKGVGHKLILMTRGLRLVAPPTQDKKTGKTIHNVNVVDASWRDVVSASEPPVKKTKASAKLPPETPPADNAQSQAFVLNYIERDTKTKKSRCRSVSLQTPQEPADTWIMQIEEKRKEGKPQKLLIVINPIGGKGTARQTFEKRVLPLFALAGVELVVKVTERAKHAIDIAKTFDVRSVDGVVVMGGDGMYMEMLHGLTVRKQEEEGVDYNDPEAKLVPPTVRVGIIPAGTGNGVAGILNGVVDTETATLNIIRGELRRYNIFSIHDSGKLVTFAGLLVANGYFSTIIKRSEELRWMKRARYPYVMLGSFVKKQRVFEYQVEVLKRTETQSSQDLTEKNIGEGNKAETAWTSIGSKQLAAVICFPFGINVDQEQLEFKPFASSYDLMILNRTSGLNTLKFMFDVMRMKRSALENECVELVQDILGMRFKFVPSQSNSAEASGGKEQAELAELAKILDVDGELVPLSSLQFEVRLHPQFLQLFCGPDLFEGRNCEAAS